ncbi:MAG: 50S ribosomal protein L11 methyltransferase [Deltaproteobacteria bacterium]|jgi:ribosomal protein L11 methyltransferase|nr:50S ribosomal protein L11 methyltransferase [Deltaproteobacteria bacterium]
MEDWLNLTLSVPPITGEAASALLFEAGARGIFEDAPDKEGRLVFQAGYPLGQESKLMAMIPAGLVTMAESFAIPLTDFALFLEIKPAEDYSELWKQDLKPFSVGPLLWIVPSWWTEPLEADPKAKILKIDPGMAFGSGLHASTFLSLTHLYDLAGSASLPRILDLGSGSGILALAAALLFPTAQIEGLDIDKDTLEVAVANRDHNQLKGRVDFTSQPLTAQKPGYDLILANLTLNTLTELAPEIKRVLNPGGHLIASGLLDDQVGSLEEAYKGPGFSLIKRLSQDGWSAVDLTLSVSES